MKKLNKTRYLELMALMCNAKVAFLLVQKSRTTGLPNASLFEAWKKLKAQYEPKDVETAQEVIEQYNECKLEGNKDRLQASKGKASVTFNRTIKAGSGYLLGIQMIPLSESKSTNGNDLLNDYESMTVKRCIDKSNTDCEVGKAVARANIRIKKQLNMEI